MNRLEDLKCSTWNTVEVSQSAVSDSCPCKNTSDMVKYIVVYSLDIPHDRGHYSMQNIKQKNLKYHAIPSHKKLV